MSKVAYTGIYFILATQDCSKNTIGRCKMNCSQTIGFGTRDKTDGDLLMPGAGLENIKGFSAFRSGLVLMPGAIVMGIMNPITGILFDKYGARALSITGLTLLALGTFGLSRLTVGTSEMYVIVIYAIRMFGIAMITMPLTTSGLNSLDRRFYSHGNAIINTLRQVAGSIGTSMIITLMTKASVYSGYTNPTEASVFGMNVSFATVGVLTTIGIILAFFTVKSKKVTNLN